MTSTVREQEAGERVATVADLDATYRYAGKHRAPEGNDK